MATQDYIRNLSEYLSNGTLSDLSLNFGEKSWRIHKALTCCHSIWFRTALNGNGEFKEANGVVTLNDNTEFADAIDCMVSYFYKAGYDASSYHTSEPLLHTQVVIIADKYGCTSLCKLARTFLANALKTVKSSDWVAIAALIYEHTIPELLAHVEFRSLLVTSILNRPFTFQKILQEESMEELLRSTPDLATDLLLGGRHRPKPGESLGRILICDNCQYAHVGSSSCPYMVHRSISSQEVCPQCGKSGTVCKKYMLGVHQREVFPCPSCDGFHTLEPALEPIEEPEEEPEAPTALLD